MAPLPKAVIMAREQLTTQYAWSPGSDISSEMISKLPRDTRQKLSNAIADTMKRKLPEMRDEYKAQSVLFFFICESPAQNAFTA